MLTQTQAELKRLITQAGVTTLASAVISATDVVTDYYQAQPESYFDLASLTKVLGTMPLLLQAIEAGHLTWSTPVQTILPQVASSQVTIKDLANHTSGIEGYIPNRDQLPAEDLKRAILQLPVIAENVGKVVHYSDSNYLWLGWVLETLYQAPIQTLIMQRVLTEQHWHELTFAPEPALCIPTADRQGQVYRGIVHDPKGRVLGAEAGSAGLFGTLAGVVGAVQWWLKHLSGSLMTQLPGVGLRSAGWKLMPAADGHLVATHTGFTGTWLMLDPTRQQALVVLTNRVYPSGQNDEFLDLRDQIMATFLNEVAK